jgi:hypothetical protein
MPSPVRDGRTAGYYAEKRTLDIGNIHNPFSGRKRAARKEKPRPDAFKPTRNMSAEKLAALEELWRTIEAKADWQVGYNPEFTAACERLRELDRKRAE